MRLTIILILVATISAFANDASARPSQAARVFRSHGLGEVDACLVFVNNRAVEHRKDRWLRAIEELWEEEPQQVLDWIVGASPPPAFVAEESARQRDCLLDLLVHDAADPATRLIVDHQKQDATKANMGALGARYSGSASFRRAVHQTLTESDHRDARTQSWIWKRKFVFSGRNFNYVSPAAAKRCGLQSEQSWKPDNGAHRECWGGRLTPPEREREILQASAAPGISRHHWGTDFDLFALNPNSFRTGRYADEYLWMTQNSLLHGFFQPYTKREARGERYMEERWHWSYYPIAQALLEFAAAHTTEVGERLEDLWHDYEGQWNRGSGNLVFFGFVRAHWQEFMFNVDASTVREEP